MNASLIDDQNKAFKVACQKQDMTCARAMRILKGEVISGNIVLVQKAKVRKKKTK